MTKSNSSSDLLKLAMPIINLLSRTQLRAETSQCVLTEDTHSAYPALYFFIFAALEPRQTTQLSYYVMGSNQALHYLHHELP